MATAPKQYEFVLAESKQRLAVNWVRGDRESCQRDPETVAVEAGIGDMALVPDIGTAASGCWLELAR